jgi:hypothetical protein
MFTKNINESKIFAGLIIIILNVGGKLIPITLSKSAENILKSKITMEKNWQLILKIYVLFKVKLI